MQVYYFEPNDGIYETTARDMASHGLQPKRIGAEFFELDLTVMTQDGDTTKGIIISHDEKTIEYIKLIRNAGLTNPLMVMIDLKNSATAAQLINEGADDVMTRPFKGIEIHARLNGINRRSHGIASPSVRIGEIVAYFDGRDPEVNGQRMRLSKREHSIFEHLALHHGKVISKENIYSAVYGMSDNPPWDKVIDVYICKLRAKIRSLVSPGDIYIETVYGRGYKLDAPDASKTGPKLIEKPRDVAMIANQMAAGEQSARFVGTARDEAAETIEN
jgi:two-component system, cell cycle response regulator CtrA